MWDIDQLDSIPTTQITRFMFHTNFQNRQVLTLNWAFWEHIAFIKISPPNLLSTKRNSNTSYLANEILLFKVR